MWCSSSAEVANVRLLLRSCCNPRRSRTELLAGRVSSEMKEPAGRRSSASVRDFGVSEIGRGLWPLTIVKGLFVRGSEYSDLGDKMDSSLNPLIRRGRVRSNGALTWTCREGRSCQNYRLHWRSMYSVGQSYGGHQAVWSEGIRIPFWASFYPLSPFPGCGISFALGLVIVWNAKWTLTKAMQVGAFSPPVQTSCAPE